MTWLLAGNVLHRDSLGSEQMIRPGQLNLMTAGRGIAHAEESPAGHDAAGRIPVTPSHEHVVFVSAGSADVEGTALRAGQLLYLGTGREQLTMAAPAGSSLFLLGGVPLAEPLLMWWNFVARTPAEIVAATREWADGGYGTVNGYDGDPLPAPALDVARLVRRRL